VPGESEDTLCRTCGTALIRRRGFTVTANRLREARCPNCGTALPGRFS
jgi:pyruvate formate lyase activating enzyme